MYSAHTTTTLGYILMALVRIQPRSGYDLMKVFTTTPMGHHSNSPGAIYPALKRLERQGWIAGKIEKAGSLRPRRVFRPTPRGTAALDQWLRKPVVADDIEHAMAELLLRFAFMTETLGVHEARRFLESFRKGLARHVRKLEAFHRETASQMPISGRLALESGIESYKGQWRWAGRALAELMDDRKKRPSKGSGKWIGKLC